MIGGDVLNWAHQQNFLREEEEEEDNLIESQVGKQSTQDQYFNGTKTRNFSKFYN